MNQHLSIAAEAEQSILPPALPAFYVTGGTLHSAAACYLTRQADQQLFEGLCQGHFCYVLTSRQMGKSSLMVRTAGRLRAADCATVILDLTALGQNLTAEQWYDGLLSRAGLQLKLEDELEEYWLAQQRLGPLQRWLNALQHVVLPHLPGRLVIFVDEIDAVRNLPFSTDEFFAGIREFYNRRTQEPELARLTFCLLGVASPSDLIQDTRTTPFNIGRRIELHDFTAAEAAPLAQGLQHAGQPGAKLLERVLYWTNGHPYLTQRLCQTLAEDPSGQTVSGVDRHCAELFLAEGAQNKDDNLLFVRERLLRSEVELSGLLTLYEQVFRQRKVANDETSPLVTTLRLSGLTRVANGRLKVRNRIYERSFDRAWMRENMPDAELRRQRAAYRKGVLRAAAVAILIVTVIGLFAFFAFHQRNLAQAEAARADQNLQQANLNADATRQALTEAEAQRQAALDQQMIAEAQRTRAENQQEINYRQLYAAQMNLAGQAWEQANVERMNELLDLHLPQPGREDLRGFEWYLLHRLGHNGLPIVRHENVVDRVFFSDGGRKLVSVGRDVVKLTDIATGREYATLKGHIGQILYADLSPDGRLLATGSNDGTVRLWDAATGKEVLAIRPAAEPILDLKFSPDGKRFATVSSDARVPRSRPSEVKLWDVATGEEQFALAGHLNWVHRIVFSSDGKRLATASNDGSAKLWDAATGQELRTLEHPSSAIQIQANVRFSPDGKRVLTLARDTVRLWEVETGKELFTLKEQGPYFAFSPDNRRLAIGQLDSSVKLRELETGKEVLTLLGHKSDITPLYFSPDGRKLATGSADNTVKLWDVGTGREITTLKGHRNVIRMMAFSPDGRLLATGSADNTARLWDVATSLNPITISGRLLPSAAFTPDGKKVVTSHYDRSTRSSSMKLFELATGQESIVHKHPDYTYDAALSPDGRILALGIPGTGFEGIARLLNLSTGQEFLTISASRNVLMNLVFSRDGQRLITSGNDLSQRVWDVATGKQLLFLRGHQGLMLAMDLSPDGKTLATGARDRTARLWDLTAGHELHAFKGHTAEIYAVAFSPAGNMLATGGDDGVVKLWDLTTKQEIMTFKGHSNRVTSVAFSRDGKRLATGGLDGATKLWDTATGQELLSLREQQGPVEVAFSPDGTLLATGSIQDQRTKLWRITPTEQVTAQLRNAPPKHRAATKP